MRIEILTPRTPDDAGATHLERGARAGALIRLRRGAYAPMEQWRTADDAARHRAAMDALVATSRRPPVFARESAALLHGIPVVGSVLGEPHVVDSELGTPSRRSPHGVVVHRPRHAPRVVEVDGMLVTDVPSTAIALAASRPFVPGLAVIDHVLSRGVKRGELEALMDEWYPFHGVRRARQAVADATGEAESPLESISLAGMIIAGLPRPRQQAELSARGARYRVDFLWEDVGVVGEADGRLKYVARDDLLAEKEREDALRAQGLAFVRWTWADAWTRTPMLAKLARAGVVAPHRAPNSATRRRSSAGRAE